MTYDRSRVETEVLSDAEALFAPYAIGRPPTWSCDQATRDLVCCGNWLDRELRRLGASDDDRRCQLWSFNRRSRGTPDVFQVAAEVMNEFEAGDIDRKPAHRRWG